MMEIKNLFLKYLSYSFIAAIFFWIGAIVQDSFTIYSNGVTSQLGEMSVCMCKYVYAGEVSPFFMIIVAFALVGIGWFLRGIDK